jgi:predicted amidohydrolase
MRVAAAAWPLDPHADFAGYEAKLSAWVADAAGQGADLLVFPEYGAMELAALGGPAVAADLEASLHEVARWRGAAEALHLRLATAHGVHILGASGPVWDGGPRPVNRATLFGPGGIVGHQDKQIMTRSEREEWHVVPGGPLRVFDTALGRLGVLICYDAEFPLLGRALAEAGAEVLLVPSCTETLAGLTRVRVGAMARALENQCIAVHAAVVGDAPWCPGVDANTGRAAVYGPPDRGFPETGILAESEVNAPGWVLADIDPEAIRRVRAEGAVLNHRDWAEQAGRLALGP